MQGTNNGSFDDAFQGCPDTLMDLVAVAGSYEWQFKGAALPSVH